MITATKAQELSETLIISYLTHCAVETVEDQAKALEMLSSSVMRALEENSGTLETLKICTRTLYNLSHYPAATGKEV